MLAQTAVARPLFPRWARESANRQNATLQKSRLKGSQYPRPPNSEVRTSLIPNLSCRAVACADCRTSFTFRKEAGHALLRSKTRRARWIRGNKSADDKSISPQRPTGREVQNGESGIAGISAKTRRLYARLHADTQEAEFRAA